MGRLLQRNQESPLERGGTIVPGCVLYKSQLKIIKDVEAKSFSEVTHPAAKAAPILRGDFFVASQQINLS